MDGPEDWEVPDFFLRNGLTPEDYRGCLDVIEGRYTDCSIVPLSEQGGCSITVVAVSSTNRRPIVVQVRLLKHAIAWNIALDAATIYASLAPAPLRFGSVLARNVSSLQVCEHTLIEGGRADDVLPQRLELQCEEVKRLKQLLEGMAIFFARGWQAANGMEKGDGKVGSSIVQRLKRLETGLSSPELRDAARKTRLEVEQGGLKNLPLVLSHGDLLPSNIMIDPDTWTLNGLVDWAEAEYLPFGMSLYGIEHLLGYMDHRPRHRVTFSYFPQADNLRRHFWRCLASNIHKLRDAGLWDAMQLSRTVGILLWHGIAWDDGRLDRVVNSENDEDEVAYLEAFLSAEGDSFGQSKL